MPPRSGLRPRPCGVRTGVFPAALVVLGLLTPVGAAHGAEGADPPPMPAAPAFYTASLSRIHDVGPDAFAFEDDAGQRCQIRLACADCTKVYDRLRGLAQSVVQSILRGEPVWIFPCGAEKVAEGPVIWACVWTSKGWLAERLIKAGYAVRREGFDAASLDAPPEIKVAAEKARPPGGGAYASPTLTADDDVFEVQHGGRTVKVRLFDVTCEGAGEASAVSDAATACLGEKPVWVFPCGGAASGPVPVRLWTAQGWLHGRLLARSLAKRYENPYKPGVQTATGSTKPTYTPPSGDTTTDSGSLRKPRFKWRKVPVTLSGKDTAGLTLTRNPSRLHVQTDHFDIASPVWRITWDMEPVFKGNAVVVNVFRMRPAGMAANAVFACTGRKGRRILQTGPGEYYIRVTSPRQMNLMVEEAVPAD